MEMIVEVSRMLFGLVVFCGLMSHCSSLRAGLIVNGDFESTTVNNSIPFGWTAVSPNTPPKAYTGNPVVPPASGSWALDLGPSGSDALNGGTISQTIFVPTAGTYLFRFDYTNERNLTSQLADFSWFLSGAITDTETLTGVGGGYVNFSRQYFISAPGNVTVGFNDIVGNGHSYDAVIDNVDFASVSANPVPEPASWAVFLCGALGLTLRRQRHPDEQ